MLEVGRSENPSVFGFGDLEDASAAELYWAASTAGDVPLDLMRNHHELAAGGDRRSWSHLTAELPRGWLLEELDARAASGAAALAVSNAAFTANHCLPDANYTNDKCFVDRSSNATRISSLSRRYQAGVCVNQGFIHDKLSYQAVTGYCGGLQPAVTIWAELQRRRLHDLDLAGHPEPVVAQVDPLGDQRRPRRRLRPRSKWQHFECIP